MSEEKMREEFEAAFHKEFSFGRLTASSNPDAAQMFKAAEWAWQASRAAVVVDLSGCETFIQVGEGSLETVKVIDAIEAAGLKVK